MQKLKIQLGLCFKAGGCAASGESQATAEWQVRVSRGGGALGPPDQHSAGTQLPMGQQHVWPRLGYEKLLYLLIVCLAEQSHFAKIIISCKKKVGWGR